MLCNCVRLPCGFRNTSDRMISCAVAVPRSFYLGAGGVPLRELLSFRKLPLGSENWKSGDPGLAGLSLLETVAAPN